MKENTVPDWKLERYLLGELPERELEGIRILEAERGGVWERLEALRADDAATFKRYPPDAMGRKIEKASTVDGDGVPKWRSVVRSHQVPKHSFWTGMPKLAVPIAVCALALLVIPLRSVITTARVDTNGAFDVDDRPKGTTQSIEVWRQNGAAAERLQQESVARSGDVVQLRYVVPESCYGALISIDGRGVLTVHLSGESGKAAKLTPGRPIALNNSYQLDDAPLFETFYLVTAKDNFDVESVTKSLKAGKRTLSGNQLITAFTLKK